jgi:hypothetical protein
VGQNAKVAGALVIGGVAGAAILGPIATLAASPAPAASISAEAAASSDPSASTAPVESTAPSTATTAPSSTTPASGQTGTAPDQDNDGPNGPGGHVEAVSDASVVAKAIGISETDLQTALAGGKTVAQVAADHNVSSQTVIDALVADGQSELDAAVKAGTMTQAQADQEKTELTQRATDQVNGDLGGGGHH